MVGFVAIFHSSQQQIEDWRLISVRCEQQQESLSAQMQGKYKNQILFEKKVFNKKVYSVVVDSKFRLDKSITAERVIHDQTKLELQQKIKNENELRDKTFMDLNKRFNSLQQHYKLLESQHHDLSEECSKNKEKQLNQTIELERKIQSLQGQVEMVESQKVKDVKYWKVSFFLFKSTLAPYTAHKFS